MKSTNSQDANQDYLNSSRDEMVAEASRLIDSAENAEKKLKYIKVFGLLAVVMASLIFATM